MQQVVLPVAEDEGQEGKDEGVEDADDGQDVSPAHGAVAQGVLPCLLPAHVPYGLCIPAVGKDHAAQHQAERCRGERREKRQGDTPGCQCRELRPPSQCTSVCLDPMTARQRNGVMAGVPRGLHLHVAAPNLPQAQTWTSGARFLRAATTGSAVSHGLSSSPPAPCAWAGAAGGLQAGVLPAKRVVVVPGSTHIPPPRVTPSGLACSACLHPARSRTQGDIREHQGEREGKCQDKACDCQGKEATLFLTTASTTAPRPASAGKAKNINAVVEQLGCAVSIFVLG